MHLKAAGFEGSVSRGNKMCAFCGFSCVSIVLAVGTWKDQGVAFFHRYPQHRLLKFRCNQHDSCWIMPFCRLCVGKDFYGDQQRARMNSSMMFDVSIRKRNTTVLWECGAWVIFPWKSWRVVEWNHSQSCSVTLTVSG